MALRELLYELFAPPTVSRAEDFRGRYLFPTQQVTTASTWRFFDITAAAVQCGADGRSEVSPSTLAQG
jgi:hypothetical protein